MSRAAKILITINGLVATAAMNPAVQGGMANFVIHHPFLTVLGAVLSSVGHLLTESKGIGR
jgi:hypothetical protein